jgi:DNA-binding MarR family transcriptional regulator
MADLKSELKQERAFGSLEEEVFLNLQRTSDALMRRLAEALKEVDLTPTQYNALRIVRGAGDIGLPCRDVGERMVTRDPDVTRLLDRLEARGLVERSREARDRRVITARITDAGAELLERTDPVVSRLLAEQLAHIGTERLRTLNTLLESARAADD